MPPSDQLVTARIILEAEAELKRRGSARLLEHLEKTEPDLAAHLMEDLSLLYQKLTGLGGRVKETRRVYRQVEELLLVSLLALQEGHRRLWNPDLPATPPADAGNPEADASGPDGNAAPSDPP